MKHVKRGVKEVVKGMRKGAKGVVIIAGDISPIDVITHVPVLCEESDVPYIYVPSKEDLGFASSTKRPTSCIMVVPTKTGKKGAAEKEETNEEFKGLYEDVLKEVKKLNETLITTV
ncbi:hypothetical protein HK102_002629 [Quaeritorhiza haematococci]|nr:hypothetical protein HK102_002629 [Quaeritorhiza haematococci]